MSCNLIESAVGFRQKLLQVSRAVTRSVIAVVITFSAASIGHSASIDLSSPEERLNYIREADTWQKPSWVNDDLSFQNSFSIKNLPLRKDEQLYANDHVACQMTEEIANEEKGEGRTPKFKCLLMHFNQVSQKWELVKDKKGKTKKIKVKYGANNPEVVGEVLASRLHWALGFGADRMFSVKKLSCFGCSEDPFSSPGLDPSTLSVPRVFEQVAIEEKMDGKEISIKESDLSKASFANAELKPRDGWTYKEIIGRRSYSENLVKAREQIIEREALLILASFLRNTDNKSDNHRLICEGKVSEEGKCLGTTRLIIHDLGYTFGWGSMIFRNSKTKVNLEAWKKATVFAIDELAGSCTVNASISLNFTKVVVSEEARRFIARLVSSFASGVEGRRRLTELFEYAAVEESGRGDVNKWVDTFIEKISELNNPAISLKGDGRRDDQIEQFVCSRRVDRVLKWLR